MLLNNLRTAALRGLGEIRERIEKIESKEKIRGEKKYFDQIISAKSYCEKFGVGKDRTSEKVVKFSVVYTLDAEKERYKSESLYELVTDLEFEGGTLVKIEYNDNARTAFTAILTFVVSRNADRFERTLQTRKDWNYIDGYMVNAMEL